MTNHIVVCSVKPYPQAPPPPPPPSPQYFCMQYFQKVSTPISSGAASFTPILSKKPFLNFIYSVSILTLDFDTHISRYG